MSGKKRDNNYYMRQEKEPSNRKAQLDRIYARDLGICQLCGEPCTRDDASRDHIKDLAWCIISEARDDNNIQLAHKLCNNLKSNPPRNNIEKPSSGGLVVNIGSEFPELGNMFADESN